MDVVSEFQKWRDEGLTADQIARKANRLGLKTKTGKRWARQNVYNQLSRIKDLSRRPTTSNGKIDRASVVKAINDLAKSNRNDALKIRDIKKEVRRLMGDQRT